MAGKLGDGAGNMTADARETTRSLQLDPGMEVIMGSEAQGGDDTWLQTTLANLNVVRPTMPGAINPYRPTPETAKLAYLMLAKLGA